MAWIELHQALRDHRKTMDLADTLGIIEPYAMGHLSCLWLWALDNAPDGVLRTCNARTIARAAGYPNDANTFVNALLESGFLERDDDDILIIHDWMDYAGKLIERREANAERMRAARATKVQPRTAHVQRTTTARAGATVPNPTEPNHNIANGNDKAQAKGVSAGVSPEATRLAEHLRSRILEHIPNAKVSRSVPILTSWAKEIGAFMEEFNHSYDDVFQVIDYAQDDETFWQGRISGASALVKSFDTIMSQMLTKRKSGNGHRVDLSPPENLTWAQQKELEARRK